MMLSNGGQVLGSSTPPSSRSSANSEPVLLDPEALFDPEAPLPPLFPNQRVLLMNPGIDVTWSERVPSTSTRPYRPANVYLQIRFDSIIPDVDNAVEDPPWRFTAADLHVSVDNWNADPLSHKRWNTDGKVRAAVTKAVNEMTDLLHFRSQTNAPAPLRAQLMWWSRNGLPRQDGYPEVYIILHELDLDSNQEQPRSDQWRCFSIQQFLRTLSSKLNALPPAPPSPRSGRTIPPTRRSMIGNWGPDWHLSAYHPLTLVLRAERF